jgi:hypothetical protein
MKRRTFIQRSTLGLGALVAGAGGAGRLLDGEKGGRRLYGIPDSVRPRTQQELDLTRYSLSRTDIPPEVWEDVLAVGLLAQDVFDHPEIAQAFSRNPRGYLNRIGLGYVSLDPNAIEVKVALALGDPEIRDAAARRDPEAFLRAIEDRGLLQNPEPSQFVSKLSSQIEEMKSSLGPDVSPESCSAVTICALAVWVWVAVVQDVVVAVAATVVVSVYAYAFVYASGALPKKKTVNVLQQAPSFRLAGALGGEEFGDQVAEAYLDDNVEKIAAAISSLRIYRDQAPLGDQQLRDLVRAQMIRQIGGHAPAIDERRP